MGVDLRGYRITDWPIRIGPDYHRFVVCQSYLNKKFSLATCAKLFRILLVSSFDVPLSCSFHHLKGMNDDLLLLLAKENPNLYSQNLNSLYNCCYFVIYSQNNNNFPFEIWSLLPSNGPRIPKKRNQFFHQ